MVSHKTFYGPCPGGRGLDFIEESCLYPRNVRATWKCFYVFSGHCSSTWWPEVKWFYRDLLLTLYSLGGYHHHFISIKSLSRPTPLYISSNMGPLKVQSSNNFGGYLCLCLPICYINETTCPTMKMKESWCSASMSTFRFVGSPVWHMET